MAKTLSLRPYQKKLLADVQSRFEEGADNVMLQLDTGAGKTGLAAEWGKAIGGRILFLAPKLEVIYQTPDEFKKWGVKACAVGSATGLTDWESAMRLYHLYDDMVLATTDGTAFNRIKKPDIMRKFSAVIVDEAHHAPDPIGKNSTRLTRLVSRATRVGIPVLGLTATPRRMSKKHGFSKTWNTLVSGPTWRQMAGKYLADVVLWTWDGDGQIIMGAGAKSGMDYKEGPTLKANSRNPNFTRGAFSALDKYARHPDGTLMQTIMYAIGQKHALKLADIAVKRGIKTGLLVSSRKILDRAPRNVEVDREKVRERMRSGDLELVINVNMVTEGFNLPDCECVIVLRPTLSVPLWKQMCGRGSRLTPNKKVLTLIDLTDNTERLGDPLSVYQWSLEPVGNKEEVYEAWMRKCADKSGDGCGALIHTGYHSCPHCERNQGQNCDTCGKFRFWEHYEGNRKTCGACMGDMEIAESMFPVISISKGWTYKGDLYYRLIMNDNRFCNVFQHNIDQFSIVDIAYHDGKVDATEICIPAYPVSINVLQNGQYLKIDKVKIRREDRWQ